VEIINFLLYGEEVYPLVTLRSIGDRSVPPKFKDVLFHPMSLKVLASVSLEYTTFVVSPTATILLTVFELFVGVTVGVLVGVTVGVLVGVTVGVLVFVALGVGVLDDVEVGVGPGI